MLKFTEVYRSGRPVDRQEEPEGMGEGRERERSLSLRQIASEMRGEEAPVMGEDEVEQEDLYRKAIVYVQEVFEAIKTKAGIPLHEGLVLVQRIVNAQQHRDDLFMKALHFNEVSAFLAVHSVNVSIFAVKLASELRLGQGQVLELGMAGLLHEVGMCRVPHEIVYKRGKLDDREYQIVREHPIYGYEVLRPLGSGYAYLAECATHEHERLDGSGYPRGLKADDIPENAQVIGLVDVYEALTHARPHREKFPHFEAVKEIIKYGKGTFQRRHLKALLTGFSVFPLHSYVKLNSNAVGKVIETYPDQPMRPKLKIIYDSQGRRESTERIIDLPENPLLYIVDSVNQKELKGSPGA